MLRRLVRSTIVPALAFSPVIINQSSALAVTPITVTIDDQSYLVTYFTGSYTANGNLFNTSSMPWWGDFQKAEKFTRATGDRLGYPNGGASPLFARSFLCTPNCLVRTSLYDSETGFNATFLADPNTTYAYATAQLAPAPVPGPLPILGAITAFGWSRKLRNSLQKAPKFK